MDQGFFLPLGMADGLAPADLPARIERISTAAHEMRRDCINLLLGLDGADEARVKAGADKVLGEALSGRGPREHPPAGK